MQVGLQLTTDIPPGFRESLIGELNRNNVPWGITGDFWCAISFKAGSVAYSDYGAFRTRSKILATQLARATGATLRASPSLRYRVAIPYLRHSSYPTAQLTINDFSVEQAQRIYIAISNYLVLTNA
jgi:hypothetical protein